MMSPGRLIRCGHSNCACYSRDAPRCARPLDDVHIDGAAHRIEQHWQTRRADRRPVVSCDSVRDAMVILGLEEPRACAFQSGEGLGTSRPPPSGRECGEPSAARSRPAAWTLSSAIMCFPTARLWACGHCPAVNTPCRAIRSAGWPPSIGEGVAAPARCLRAGDGRQKV